MSCKHEATKVNRPSLPEAFRILRGENGELSAIVSRPDVHLILLMKAAKANHALSFLAIYL